MRTIFQWIVVAIVAIFAFSLISGSQNKAPEVAAPQAPAVAQAPVQVTTPPVVQQAAPTAAPAVQAPAQTLSTWQCPGEAVPNNGCLVKTTTNLIQGLCVDYDPGASVIAGPHEDKKTTPGWTRSLMTGMGAWTPNLPQATATIYPDATCPPY